MQQMTRWGSAPGQNTSRGLQGFEDPTEGSGSSEANLGWPQGSQITPWRGPQSNPRKLSR